MSDHEKKLKKEKKRERQEFADDPEGMKWALESEKEAGRRDAYDSFVWTAKREKLVRQGLDPRDVEREEEAKRAERLAELEKIKQARAERDREQELWEAEKRRADAQGEDFSYAGWIQEEKEFHLKQAKERAEIRLREGRPKPIDLLHKNLEVDTKYRFDMRPPYEMLDGMSLKQLEELSGDVAMYLELSPQEEEFWKALQLLCREKIALMTGKTAPVEKDVLEVFQGQSMDELKELKANISEQMEQGEDPEYWEALHRQAGVEIARATLKSIHASKLQLRLAQLKEEEREAERKKLANALKEKMEGGAQRQEAAAAATTTTAAQQPEQEQQKQSEVKLEAAVDNASDVSTTATAASTQGPRRRKREKLILEEVEDYEEEEEDLALQDERIQQLMEEVQQIDDLRVHSDSGHGASTTMTATGEAGVLTEQDLLRVEMDRAFDENEENFADEIETTITKMPAWTDKYEPRKPLYYNRIKTGYEWNKYNSTHYTADNPPPKVVHGYRFNIFYSDLVDPSKTPTFKKEPIPGNHDWVILRFKAGPPYLDVAFKIVNKDWDRDSKYGFKAVFERGVLRLWFNLKRTRYKR